MRQPIECEIDQSRDRQNKKIKIALGSQFEAKDARQRHIQKPIAAAGRPIFIEHDKIDDDVKAQRRNRKTRAWQFHDRHQQKAAECGGEACGQKCQRERHTETQRQHGRNISADSVKRALPER